MYHEINTAVAGTGFIGPVHVEALRRLGVHVCGILGSTPEKSLSAARGLGLKKGYKDFDEILKDPTIDVVHIATPNVLHFTMAKSALENGKHVMCEKPLAMTSAETEVLVDAASRSGKMAAVTYNVRFYPMNIEARMKVANGSLGRLFSVVGSYVQDWLMYDTDYNWRVSAEKGGALRAVADIGTHWMDLVQSVTSKKISNVCADLATVHKTRKKPLGEVQTFSGETAGNTENLTINTEDCGSIMFRMEDGVQGVLWVSQVSAGFKNRIRYEISGSKESVSWDSDRANQLVIGHRNEANNILEKDPSLTSAQTLPFINYPGGHSEGFPDTFKQCFRSFYDAIIDTVTTPMYPSFEDGHREVLLCEAILKSNERSKWVSLD